MENTQINAIKIGMDPIKAAESFQNWLDKQPYVINTIIVTRHLRYPPNSTKDDKDSFVVEVPSVLAKFEDKRIDRTINIVERTNCQLEAETSYSGVKFHIPIEIDGYETHYPLYGFNFEEMSSL